MFKKYPATHDKHFWSEPQVKHPKPAQAKQFVEDK